MARRKRIMAQEKRGWASPPPPMKAVWLKTLDDLEQEFLAFQQRAACAPHALRAHAAAPRRGPEQLVLDLRIES